MATHTAITPLTRDVAIQTTPPESQNPRIRLLSPEELQEKQTLAKHKTRCCLVAAAICLIIGMVLSCIPFIGLVTLPASITFALLAGAVNVGGFGTLGFSMYAEKMEKERCMQIFQQKVLREKACLPQLPPSLTVSADRPFSYLSSQVLRTEIDDLMKFKCSDVPNQ